MTFFTDLLLQKAELGEQLSDVLTKYIFPFALALVVLWAFWLGWNMMKAKDEGERRQTKERLLKALMAIFIIGMLYAALLAINWTYKNVAYENILFDTISFLM